MDGKRIGPYFFVKIRIVRKLLGRTQRQVAYELGRSQRDLSLVENGIRDKMAPHDLLNYYYENGVDLNWLYEQEDEENITYQSAELKAFRTKNGLSYFRVRQAEAEKLLSTTSDNYSKYFEQIEVPLKARISDTYVGFRIEHSLSPYTKDQVVICRKTALPDIKPDHNYLLIIDGKLVSRRSGDRKPANSDKYVHYVDGRVQIKDIEQMWEPIQQQVQPDDNAKESASLKGRSANP
ncbi:MAG: helix-turn-helix transcriptional regulator [Cyclobacteriaceae bacterium]